MRAYTNAVRSRTADIAVVAIVAVAALTNQGLPCEFIPSEAREALLTSKIACVNTETCHCSTKRHFPINFRLLVEKGKSKVGRVQRKKS